MNEEQLKNSLFQSHAHLGAYLGDLNEATKPQVILESRWPWQGKIVTAYPESLGQWIVLFLKTMRFDFASEARKQTIQQSINVLQVYQRAVEYEVAAMHPSKIRKEEQFLRRLDEWLERLTTHLEDQPELSEEQKKSLVNWSDCLADVPTFLTSASLLQLLQKGSREKRAFISQVREGLQQRLETIPDLIEKSIEDAEKYFQRHRPDHQDIPNTAAKLGSLYNFFTPDDPRPEMLNLYAQVTRAAKIWNQVKNQKDFQTKYELELGCLHEFFQNTIDEQGPFRDAMTGFGLTDQFFIRE